MEKKDATAVVKKEETKEKTPRDEEFDEVKQMLEKSGTN